MVESTGLENRRGASHRGFESHPLRQPSRFGWHANSYPSIHSHLLIKKLKEKAVHRSFSEGGHDHAFQMKYVYLIRSESFPNQTYVGVTSNVQTRLKTHNSGGSTHTSKFRPWKLITYIAFSDNSQALAFEIYLKTGSGRAFAKKKTLVEVSHSRI